MSSQPLLSGTVVDDRDRRIAYLEMQNAQLSEALRLERNKVGAIEAGARELRRTTLPLYRALQKVHGDLDAMAISDDTSAPTAVMPAAKSDAWSQWKQKLPGWPAKIIDALLAHGELSTAQLVVAAQCSRKQTIYDTMSKLGRLGLVRSVGGKYSLTDL